MMMMIYQWQLSDERVHVGLLRRLYDVLQWDPPAVVAVRDVVADAPREEYRFLLDEAELCAQLPESERALDVQVVQQLEREESVRNKRIINQRKVYVRGEPKRF